jgi:hypothetical protein
MLSAGSLRRPSETSLSGCCQLCSVPLTGVVGDGHQGPFTVHLLQPPSQEVICGPYPLDLTEHRLNNGLA